MARQSLPPLEVGPMFPTQGNNVASLDCYLDCSMVSKDAGIEGVDYTAIHGEECEHAWVA